MIPHFVPSLISFPLPNPSLSLSPFPDGIKETDVQPKYPTLSHKHTHFKHKEDRSQVSKEAGSMGPLKSQA